MAAMSSHTLKRPRTAGLALVAAGAIAAASFVTVALTRGGGGGETSVPHSGAAQVTASLPVTVGSTQGAPARVTIFSDPHGRLRAPRDVTVGPDGNVWFAAGHAQIGRVTPGGELTLYRDPAGLIDTPDTIITGADGALWFNSLGDRIGASPRAATSRAFPSAAVTPGDRWHSPPAPTATCGSPPRAIRSDG
jgi:streptogramin lyase